MAIADASVQEQLREAHGHCHANERELSRSDTCGCFFCFATFSALEIKDWAEAGREYDEHNRTAICPKCGVDSVLGSASNFPLSTDFLKAMHRRFFDNER
jgi:hypothetical protein